MVDKSKMFQTCDIHEIPVNISNMEQALLEVESLFNSHQHHYVCFFEGNLLSRAIRENDVKNAISQASLIYPDGIVVAKEVELKFKRPVSRVPGPSFLLSACEYGIKRKWRHFFLGGSNGVAEKLVANLKKRYPGIQIAGWYSPPFRDLTEEEEEEIRRETENTHTDFLWVGLGGPKQEFWMKKHLNKINVPVMLGVGAAFDFHSGNRPWAPLIVRKIGAEWLYRTISGGKRTFFRNIKCVFYLTFVYLFDLVKYKCMIPFRDLLKKK